MRKILNLYAGLGGNRKLWQDVEVTAVEWREDIAQVYRDYFTDDKVVIGDAHEYLRKNFGKFDFIWSSPPCQTHSSFRFNIGVRYRGVEPKYPDLSLYEEILFLQHHTSDDQKWVVENVNPYYEPLIKETAYLQRHMFWSNFEIADVDFKKDKIRSAQIPDLQKLHGFDLSEYKIKNKRQVLRNCVLAKLGLHIYEQAYK